MDQKINTNMKNSYTLGVFLVCILCSVTIFADETPVRFSLKEVGNDAFFVELVNVSKSDLIFNDTVFEEAWHSMFPLGVTIYFKSNEGAVFGINSDANSGSGWNERRLNSKLYFVDDYIRLLKSRGGFSRKIEIQPYIDSFRRRYGDERMDGLKGVYVIRVTINFIACDGPKGWHITDSLVKEINFQGTFSPGAEEAPSEPTSQPKHGD